MALPPEAGGRPRPHPRRPPLRRHSSFPLPKPEIQTSAPKPRKPKPTGVFRGQPLAPPTRNLTRPAPVKRAERKLPPAPMPSYPVLKHYTKPQQRAVVRGIQRSGNRVADRGAIRPEALAPLAAVRAQQQAAANRRYAKAYGVTPQQAAVLRAQSNVRSHAQAKVPRPPSLTDRIVHALLTGDTGQPSIQTGAAGAARGVLAGGLQPATGTFNPLGATYEKAPRIPYSGPLGLGTLAESLSYDAARNTRTADAFGQAVSEALRSSSRRTRSGAGGTAIAPGFVRSPLADVLLAASKGAPVASRIVAGAGNDIGQFVLGAVPSTVQLAQQAATDPRGALKTLATSTEDILRHPQDHPLFALQLLHGGVRGVSRTAGALGRSPLAPKGVRRALSTQRAPLQIGGPAATRLLEYRHYSKDPLVKAMQVIADRRLPEGARVRDQRGREVSSKVARGPEVGKIGQTIDALLTTSFGTDARGRLRRLGDFTADRANAVERHNRAAIQRELVGLMPTRAHRGGRAGQAIGGYLDKRLRSQPTGVLRLPARAYRPERDVIGLVIRGRVRSAATFRADLEAELGRLKARAKKSFDHPEERALNLQNQRSIERVLADPKAMAPTNVKRLVDAGRQLAARGRDLTREAVRQGALSPEAAARAPLFDYALAHMKARYMHVDDHAALEREHMATERAAGQRVHEAAKAVRDAEQALKEGQPHLASPPDPKGVYLNRRQTYAELERLDTEHADVLRRLNEASRATDQAREQMAKIPAGPAREAFRKDVYRPLSDTYQRIDTQARGMYKTIAALKERVDAATRGDLVTGQPNRPVHEVTWYHGTEGAYEGLPAAVRTNNDLGVYLTSDPHYASGYAENAAEAAQPHRRVVLAHVNPRKTLDTRFGRANPDEIARVIERVLQRDEELRPELQRFAEEHIAKLEAGRASRGETPKPREVQQDYINRIVSSHGLGDHTRNILELGLHMLKTDEAFRKAVAGKDPDKTGARTAYLEGWQQLDRTLMRQAGYDLRRAEIALNDLKGPREGTLHQPVRQILREFGYDAVRKIDQHADSLVVLNESIMRRPGEPRPNRRGAKRGEVTLGSHLEAQDFEAAARDHNVHVVSTTRKGDGMVAHVEGTPEAIDRLAAQHAFRTDSPVLSFHHDPKGSGFVYEIRQGNKREYLFDPHGDPHTAEVLAERYGAKNISATPGAGRMLTAEHHAQAVRDIQTAGDQGVARLTRDLESARRAHAEAKAAHAAARETRIAVSGRHPELVEQHEAAVAAAATAKGRMKKAQAAHAREVAKRNRTIGGQASRRGRRQREALGSELKMTRGERPAGRATAAEKAKLDAHDAAIKEAAAVRRAAEKAHREARAAVPPRPEIQPALRTAEGKLLTNKEIHDHMREAGIPVDKHGPLISYLPDRPDVNTRGSYHRAQALLRRDTPEAGFHRTGAAQEKGVTGQSFNLVADHMVRMGITTGDGAIGQFDKLVRESGVVRPDGKPFTAQEAELALHNLNKIPNQPRLVAVRMFPGRYSPAQRDLIQRMQNPEALDPTHYGSDFSNYVERSFADRVARSGEQPAWMKERGTRNVALLPEELVHRFQQHLSALGNRSPTGALLARGFRTAVLPFSAKWLTGNVAEAIIRLAVIGANPFDYVAGRRSLKHMLGRPAREVMGHRVLNEIIALDAEHAGLSTEVGSSLLSGLLYGEPGLTVHRGVSDYEHTNLRVPAEVIGGLAHTTMLREIGHELNRIPQTVFSANRWLERQTQYVALGRHVRRDIQEFSDSYLQTLRLQHKAVREAARGLYNTPAQHDAARYMDETLGKYSRFSPRLRAFIQTATPFLPWYLNAARFVFWTLPMKHPTKTAVLVAAEHAYSKDFAAQHKDLPPGELKSAVKHKGGWLDLARFTPFGAFTGAFGGDARTLLSPFLPQAQGIWHALSGEDPFGRQLQVPKTKDNPKGAATQGDVYKTAFNQVLGGFLPGYSPIERIAQHGETGFSGRSSLLFGIHTKPGSSHGSSGLSRWLNPVRPVYLKPPAAKGGPPPGMSKAEYEKLLQEARHEAHSTGGVTPREKALLLKEARQAAGIR